MSSLKVEVVKIDSILPHPNADRLEIAQIAGWTCVVQKGMHKAGDAVIYIPVDSVLPATVESYLFPPDSKVTLDKHRIKTIKLRGAISQGLIISLDDYDYLIAHDPRPNSYHSIVSSRLVYGDDVAIELGITKYEPPEKAQPAALRGNMVSPKKGNPLFHKYTDIENFKHYNTLFEDGELVYVTEKLHGTAARYGYLPTVADTWFKKIKKFFGLLPEYEFCYGSRNVQLQSKKQYNGYYPTDVYSNISRFWDFPQLLGKDYIVYGEIIGGGIQKNYTYGLGPNTHKLYVYDIQMNGEYLSPREFLAACAGYGLTPVPLLYIGPYSQATMDELRSGDSTIGGQKVREGIVIKPLIESKCYMGRKVLKYLNDEYLLKEQDEFH